MEQTIYKKASKPGRKYIDTFLGLNRKDIIAENEFSDLMNMDSAHYPMLAPCLTRKKVIDQGGIKAVVADNNMDGDALTALRARSFIIREQQRGQSPETNRRVWWISTEMC